MKKIIYSITTIVMALMLSACSEEGGDASFENGQTLIDVSIECVVSPTTTDIDSYITLESGDTIVKDDANATVSIYHDENGNKKICLVSGTAHIVR